MEFNESMLGAGSRAEQIGALSVMCIPVSNNVLH